MFETNSYELSQSLVNLFQMESISGNFVSVTFLSSSLQIGDFAILLKSGFRRWDAAVGQVCFDLLLAIFILIIKSGFFPSNLNIVLIL